MGELITMQQAADAASVSVKTIRRWIADGIIPGYRIGRFIRIKPDELAGAMRRIPTRTAP